MPPLLARFRQSVPDQLPATGIAFRDVHSPNLPLPTLTPTLPHHKAEKSGSDQLFSSFNPPHSGSVLPTQPPLPALAARRRRGHKKNPPQSNCERILGGANGTRTRNPLLAKQVRYQLRHSPIRPDQLLQSKVALANV